MDAATADAHGGKVNGDAAVASDGSPPPAPPVKTAAVPPPADDAEAAGEHVSDSNDEEDKGVEAKAEESEKDAGEMSTSRETDEAETAGDQPDTKDKDEDDADGDKQQSTGDKDEEEPAKEQEKEKEEETEPSDDKAKEVGEEEDSVEVPPTPSDSAEGGDKTPDADASPMKSKGRGRPKAKQAAGGTPKGDKAPAKPRTPKTAPAPSVAPADSPAATAGRRERRTVERLQMDEGTSNKAKPADEPAGSGTKLGDIEYIEQQIAKARPDELKVLHRACFGRPGTSHELRKNLRKFNGFAFGAKSDEYSKKFTAVSKWSKSDMSNVLKLLALDKGGNKEQQADRVLDYLLKPADSGKKKSAAGGKRARPSGSKKGDAVGDSSASEHVESSDDDVAPPPPAKKPRGSPKASPVKKPTDGELKAVIKKMLTNVSLEDTTMKEMFKMVAAKFPKVDLTARKDFIKQTVKAMIEAKA